MDNSIKEQKMRKRGGRRKSKTLVKKHLNPQEYAEILEVEELLKKIYTHVSTKDIGRIRSPLDNLSLNKE